MSTASALNRQQTIQSMQEKEYDLLIIGGGITGVGIALDAITRGLTVALVEMHDFASGTSSKSTKLVHGGLRYLKQLQVKEVAELGKERAIVYENGPHVTTPVWMLLPFHKGGTFGKYTTSLGLSLYDYLAGVKKSERRYMLNVNQTMEKEPLLKREALLGGGMYVEYRTDDARLTIEVAKKAIEYGAELINYVKATKFKYNENGTIIGIEATNVLSNETFTIQAKKVVNAAGPWVDFVREMEGNISGKHLILSKGVHIVFDETVFPLKQAIYFDTKDKRMVFAIPRNGKTYVGTTDTFYKGNPKNITVTQEDRDYLMNAIHYMFPEMNITDEQIESSWAGVRPLIHEEGKSPSEISRHDEVWESASGLITIAGGKLTGYRKMAQAVVNLIVEKLQRDYKLDVQPCVTKRLVISGGDVGGSAEFLTYVEKMVKIGEAQGIKKEEASYLTHLYGSNVETVFSYIQQAPATMDKIVYAQLMYSVEHELVVNPSDFFIRRTGDLFFNIDRVIKNNQIVIKWLAQTFGWTEEQQEVFAQQLADEIERATTASNL